MRSCPFYVEEEHTGLGMGKALYHALMELLKPQNVKMPHALITSPNERSEALHLGMGFRLGKASTVKPVIKWENGLMFPVL